jgi:hypothetical protein
VLKVEKNIQKQKNGQEIILKDSGQTQSQFHRGNLGIKKNIDDVK